MQLVGQLVALPGSRGLREYSGNRLVVISHGIDTTYGRICAMQGITFVLGSPT